MSIEPQVIPDTDIEEGQSLATIAEYALGEADLNLEAIADIAPENPYLQTLVNQTQQEIRHTQQYLKLTLAALLKVAAQRNEAIEERVRIEESMKRWESGLYGKGDLHPAVLELVADMRHGLGYDEAVVSGINRQMEHFAEMLEELTGCSFDDAWNVVMLLDEGNEYSDGVDSAMVDILQSAALAAHEMYLESLSEVYDEDDEFNGF